jgi:hypothetical protein
VSDPFLSAYWTIDQVIAWAQFRDGDMVRRVAHANSHPSVVFKGLRLAAEQDQTIQVPDKGFYATSTEAEQAILEALKSGRLTAYGLENNKGDLKPVPTFQWATMAFYMDSKFKTYAEPPDLLRPNATQWTMLQLERKQVIAVFPANKSIEKADTESEDTPSKPISKKADDDARKPPQAAQRDDALSRLARKIYKALCDKGEKPTYRQVINALRFYDDKGEFKNTIEEIDNENEMIWWVNDRGHEQSTSFNGFKKRMTRIRKTPPTK